MSESRPNLAAIDAELDAFGVSEERIARALAHAKRLVEDAGGVDAALAELGSAPPAELGRAPESSAAVELASADLQPISESVSAETAVGEPSVDVELPSGTFAAATEKQPSLASAEFPLSTPETAEPEKMDSEREREPRRRRPSLSDALAADFAAFESDVPPSGEVELSDDLSDVYSAIDSIAPAASVDEGESVELDPSGGFAPAESMEVEIETTTSSEVRALAIDEIFDDAESRPPPAFQEVAPDEDPDDDLAELLSDLEEGVAVVPSARPPGPPPPPSRSAGPSSLPPPLPGDAIEVQSEELSDDEIIELDDLEFEILED